ncbi:hypothetical protein BDFB_009809 [Asbolus verrucosus]|uniref:Nucleotide exchange factor SIL1 n=1 Tax=Asbolus verrucosus TaxID=1661398 RepID=A0A482V8T7_ASBVE|nr:hypothetical protein BDFB_009809 [Asbolus verrucosus]
MLIGRNLVMSTFFKLGQKIPKGLHIRMNLETGLTEAKLLDDSQKEEDKSKALLSVPQDPEQEEKINEKAIPKSVLEEAVKNIKDKFRSYNEIKRSLGQLNLTPKIDSEVIADLLRKHKEILSEEKPDKFELLKVIEDLDFLAHQYDNAREFVNQNGFQEIIYKNINSSSSEIRRDTLRLMGSLMQNNVVPKIHALESGAVGILLRLISFDPDSGVKTRALTALSALLRSFPVAQQKFIENGGLTILSNLFEAGDVKIQLKLVTIISDLIIEHHWGVVDMKLTKYYNSFDLTKHVLEHNWCENLNKFLLKLVVTDKDDHDSIEKCLTAMHGLRVHCGGQYNKNLLTMLAQHYQNLGHNGRDDSENEDFGDSVFFNVLKNLCDEILHYAYKNSIKTEL